MSSGETHPVDYHVVDMSQVAHPAAGDPLQPRNRETSASSDAQIGKIAGNLDPRQLLHGETADIGPPVVNQQGTLLAGNGRFAAIRTAAENHPQKYDAYVQAIKDAGHEIPPGVQRPVLVRRTGEMTPEAQLKLARDSNVSRSMSMSAVEQAHVDAAHISDEMMQRYAHGDPRSERAWLQTLPETERNAVIDQHGQGLSKAGKERLKGAMLARAYDSPDLLTRALEDPNDDTKGITNSLADVAPSWAKMRARIAADEIPKEFDITDHLTKALDMVRQQRDSGGKMTPNDMVNQMDLDRGPLDPITEQLYRSFYNDGMTRLNSAKGLTGILDDYLKAAHNYTPQETFAGFEPAKPNPAEILKGLRSGKQESLFDTTGGAQALNDAVEEGLGQGDEFEPLSAHDQAFLDTANEQIARLEKSGAAPEQLQKLMTARDSLLSKRRRRATKRTTSQPPKSDLAPRTFEDHKFQHGLPVYRDAYYEMALDSGATPEEAETFASLAISKPLEQQVEMLREKVKEKFEYKEVAISEGHKPYEARNALLDLHRAIQDMMHAMGMPNRMASMLGTNTLELEPLTRQSKGYGSYTPGTRTITVRGRSNVFGHEWTHALDHFMVDFLLNQSQHRDFMATQLGRTGILDPSDPLAQRIGHLLNTLFHNEPDLAAKLIELGIKAGELRKDGKPTAAALKAQKIIKAVDVGAAVTGVKPSEYFQTSQQYGQDKYWTQEWEMLARAGEAYLSRTMTLRGLDPRGVLLPDNAYGSDSDPRLRDTFPGPAEQMAIFQAFDHMMDGFRQTALSGSVAASQATRGGTSDPSVWGVLNKSKPYTPLKTLVQRMRNWRETLNRTRLTDPNRPDPGAHHLLHRAQLLAEEEFFGRVSFLHAMLEFATPEQKVPLQEIIDRIAHKPGSGRYNPWDTIEEAAHVQQKEWMRLYSNSLENAGFDPETMTQQDKDHIRHAMQTGDNTYPLDPTNPNGPRVPISAKHAKVSGELSVVMSQVFDGLNKSGMEIGHAKSGYFPRHYDQVRAFSEAMKFVTQATKMYRRMFDDEVGPIGDHPDRLLEKWNLLNKAEKDNAPPATQTEMKALQRNLAKQAGINNAIAAAGGVATQAQSDELDQLQQEAEQFAQANHDAVGDQIADINATVWHSDVVSNYAHDIDKNIPGGRFLNARTLPPYADQYMREFMINDMLQVLPHYFESAARKIAYVDRFGKDDSDRKSLIKRLEAAKMHPVDIKRINKIIDSVAGKTNNDNSRGDVKIANNVQAAAATAMMGRASFTMWAEPFIGALHTGKMRVGFENMVGAMGQFLRTASAEERTKLADLIGVTSSATLDDVLMNRVSADYSDSPLIGKFMAQYYRMTWIAGITNGSKRGSIRGHNWALIDGAREILNPSQSVSATNARARAIGQFNEWGVPPEHRIAFAEWLGTLDGLPDLHDPANAMYASTYARAMRRLGKRTIIDTDKIQKPLPTDDKYRGMMYQFLNYAYGMQDNVLDVMAERIKQEGKRNYKRNRDAGKGPFWSAASGASHAAWATGYTAAGVLAYLLWSAPQTIIREHTFNRHEWDKHEADGTLVPWLMKLVMDRSALGGIFQFPMEVLANLRFNTDLSSVFNGAGPSYIAKNVWSVISLPFNPSGDTSTSNARYHNAVKGFYNLGIVPLEAWIATKIASFGPAGVAAAGAGYAYLSSPGFVETVADKITGKKGTVLPKEKEDDSGLPPLPEMPEMPELPEMPALPETPGMPGAGQGDKTGSSEGTSGAQGAGAVPWGLLDDFLAPAWKAVKPVFGLVPGKAKAALAIGIAGSLAHKFWEDTKPYREAPPPKPKENQEGETP